MKRIPPYHPFRSAGAKEKYLEFYAQKAARWPVPAEGKIVSTSYGQTFVHVGGIPGAQPLVLLPGGSANSLMWWPNIKAFSKDFETFAIDNLYDFGRSVYTRKPQKPGDLIAWLDELFDGLGLGRNIHLIGLSLGGWMTSLYAIHSPNRLKKTVLIAPANTILMIQPEFGLRAISTLLPFRFFTRRFVYWLFHDLMIKEPAGKQLADELIDELYFSFRCFQRFPMVVPTVLTDAELQNAKVPTLFLVGENEKIYSAQAAVERIRRLAPRWRTDIIPSAGHDLTFSQAEIVNKKVVEFLLSSES
jgi:pimeloyl-ACP methyl ester carboxylesterase